MLREFPDYPVEGRDYNEEPYDVTGSPGCATVGAYRCQLGQSVLVNRIAFTYYYLIALERDDSGRNFPGRFLPHGIGCARVINQIRLYERDGGRSKYGNLFL
jgi:hypothetical protein